MGSAHNGTSRKNDECGKAEACQILKLKCTDRAISPGGKGSKVRDQLICLLCGFLLHAISARALFKSVCKPLIGRGKGLRLKAFCLLEGNDAIRVIDLDHTGVLRRSFRFHFFSPLHIRFMIFIKACRLLPDRRQTSQLRRFSPRAAHSAQTPSSAAAVDQNARSG